MPLKWYFKIDKGQALGPQIENGIKAHIASGIGAQNERMPSYRRLASLLEVNPLTVQRAYNNLIAENVLYSRERSGTFVNPSSMQQAKTAQPPQLVSLMIGKPLIAKPADCTHLILGNEFPSIADIDYYRHISNFRLVYDLISAKKYRDENLLLTRNKLLQATLARRNIYVRDDEQLLINGLELSLKLTLGYLTAAGDTIAICSASCPSPSRFELGERMTVYCPADEDGLPLQDQLLKLVSDKRLKAIILYNADRFQTESTDFEQKRKDFVDFAVSRQLAIIELDKDHEFWFGTPSSTSLKADYTANGNIIYISPISKLAPYLYNMVAVTGPASFIDLLKQRYTRDHQAPDPLLYSAASYFFDTRKSNGMIRKLQMRYQRKRLLLHNMVAYNSKLDAQILFPVAGLWAWIVLNEPIYSRQLKDLPACFRPYILSHQGEKPIRHICIGIASFKPSELQKLVHFLEKTLLVSKN